MKLGSALRAIQSMLLDRTRAMHGALLTLYSLKSNGALANRGP